ncbi:MAG: helix-hairpin-helix domain-containing protein [Candidatus Marsarchaeota archaeon]|nr:helix-hairpin-helix domain-containing protein [Candidatus Marsarchaeota archaeon]
MPELRLIVDNRERNLEIIDSLAQENVKLSFAQLPVGDYIVSDRMCIERKTVHDFESSIMDSRIFDQATRLREAFKNPIILIEGDLGECTLGRNAILGAVLSLYTDYGVLVLNSESPSDTSYMLAKFAEREQLGKRREPRLAGSKKAYTQYQWQLLILGSLPGIGPNLAKNLINNFKTIRNLCNADIKELMKVEKIGKKKAESIFKVVNSEFLVE